MHNPNETETPPHPLTPCYSYLAEYLRKIDRNGASILHDYMHNAKTPADIMRLLTDVLRTRFNEDVVPCPFAVNLEDRENAFAVLERAENFNPVAYSGEFLRLAPYILRNVTPSA